VMGKRRGEKGRGGEGRRKGREGTGGRDGGERKNGRERGDVVHISVCNRGRERRDGRGREGNQSHAFCFPNLGSYERLGRSNR